MNLEDRLRDALTARADSDVGDLESTEEFTSNLEDRARHRERKRVTRLSAATFTVGVVVAVAVATLGDSTSPNGSRELAAPRDRGASIEPGRGQRLQFGTEPEHPTYPESAEVANISAAQSQVSFDIIVPETDWTTSERLIGVFVLPGGAVALDYRGPEPETYLRQEYIEVYEAPWDPTVDPAQAYEEMINADPHPDVSLISVDGLPALAVNAHAEADDDQANPAFLRVVVGSVELQISGGESIDRLAEIASAMIRSENAGV